jgi:vitamin B12 transporter
MKNNTLQISLAVAVFLTANSLGANENYDLGTISVSSATKSEQSIKDVTSNVEIISGLELEEKNIKTVAEALNLVSGISFVSNGGIGATTFVSLRGSDNNRVLILIDGIKYKDHSSISGTDISHLMINNIEKIEVIKGAQSGIWGADAAAGVINIITKSPKKGVSGSILVEAGSFKTKKLAGEISYKENLFDILLSGSKLTTDGFTSQAPKDDNIDQYEDDGYKNEMINLKSNFYFNDNSKLGLNIVDIDALKEYDSFNDPDDTTMENDTSTRAYAVLFDQTYNNHKISLKYDRSKIKRDQIGTTWGVKYTQSRSDNIEITDNISYNQKDFVVFGGGKNSDKIKYIRADGTSDNGKNESKFGYLTNSNSLENIILTESIRYDSFDNFKNSLTGKIGLKYNLNENISLFTNYGSAYTVPSLIQNINPWGAVNMNIDPEKSRNFDVGFQYKDLKVTYFEQKIKDLITWNDPTPLDWFNNDAVYTNLDGKNILKGIELDYQKEILQDTLFSMSYTYLSAKDKDKNYLARKAQENLKFGIDYYGISKLHIGVNGEYIGKRYDQADKQGEQTGKYTVANLNINYEYTNNIKLYGKIENLTDKYYQSIDGFTQSPRSFYAGLKYSF